MKLSVVIVNYNIKYFLEQCLDSVIRAVSNIESEVFVVDNASSDHSIDYLAPKFPQVVFIANKENAGFSKANNQAIRLAKGEYILLLNPDTLIGENTPERICRFMDEHPEAGGAGVKMIDGYGRFLPESKRGFPSPWNSFCKMLGLTRLFPQSKMFGKYYLRYLPENEINEVDVLAGAFMMLRKKTLDEIGLLDESFFMYGEDIDLSYRIRKGGYKNYYLPEPVIHYKGECTKKDFKYVKNFYEAMLIFYRKHYPDACFIYRWLIRLAVNMLAVLSVIGKLSGRNVRKIYHSEHIYTTENLSYREIIEDMDRHSRPKVLFKIMNHQTGITIAPGEVSIKNETP
ncbi:MAG: glycosyltransferase family 2 protein [Dysgonamonadaceae bacterium]|jgi:GT2 family glycosyltransferase|nr:glycosyltransferase family 2 protein [Dysgonamonadaceae bacterium]